MLCTVAALPGAAAREIRAWDGVATSCVDRRATDAPDAAPLTGRLQELGAQHRARILPGALTLVLASRPPPRLSWSTTFKRGLTVCVPFIINQTPAAGGDHCHGPQRAALSGLWAIPSTESGPQPLLVTYNLSSLALTPGEPTPYVCMYVSMVHTHMWYVRGYVLGEGGVNASTSRGRNSKLEG